MENSLHSRELILRTNGDNYSLDDMEIEEGGFKKRKITHDYSSLSEDMSQLDLFAKIEGLPSDILFFVFHDFLSKRDIKQCRIVCKGWNIMIQRIIWSKTVSLKFAKISNEASLFFCKICPYLQKLSFDFCEDLTDSGTKELWTLSNLEHLSLHDCNQITNFTLYQISQLDKLVSLDLAWCDKITNNGLSHIGKLIHLQELRLDYCKKITDEGIVHVSKLKDLKLLSLIECSITDIGLRCLIQQLSLEELNIKFCEKIRNPFCFKTNIKMFF